MKWIRWVLLKIQSGHDSVHRRTDGQGDTSIPPFQLRWSGGYNKLVHSPLLFTCQNSRQKRVTNDHLEMGHYLKCHISCWNMVSQAWHAVTNPRLVARTFGLDIGIIRTVSVWRCCECEANSSKKFDKTANMTPILKEADQSEFISGGPVSLIYCVW